MITSPGWGLWLHGIRPVPELVALAVAAERHGASAILIADEGIDRDIYVVLAAIAAATERVHLVPGITNPFSRHPVATAAALASLAELAPGRVVAGLGTGGSMVFGPMGIKSSRRYSTLRETVDVVGALLRGEEVTHHGEFATERARLPWSPEPLPIGIAGRGPKVMALAATADWLILAGKPLAKVRSIAEGARAAAQASGRARPVVVWNPAAAWRPEWVAATRPRFTYMTIDMPRDDRLRIGVDDETVDEMRRLLLTGGPEAAAHLVPDAVLEHHAVVGDRATVLARLGTLVAEVQPDVLAFETHEYSVEYVAELAELVADVDRARAGNPA